MAKARFKDGELRFGTLTDGLTNRPSDEPQHRRLVRFFVGEKSGVVLCQDVQNGERYDPEESFAPSRWSAPIVDPGFEWKQRKSTPQPQPARKT